MKIWTALKEALAGWIAMVRGEADWQRHFAISAAGLTTALVLFLFFALLSIALATADVGIPNFFGLIIALLVQSLSILALLIGILVTRRMVPGEVRLLDLLVPGIYALIAYLVVGTLLSLIAGPVLILLWIGLAVLLFYLGWRAAEWNIGVAAAFAALTMVLLVGMPVTLYMVLGPVAAPPP
ncbi:hypothetical protein ASD83_20160 [Devosia sp. Root685]|uniref:hypothetical protein n=1 Tax=Devosia sp. Root685 TaxID=1736587 RepID=UPI0006FC0336|nr:hypothetical protein [Devosia sp. Root685]KRA95131.1 hypothetical protein ASD83_20160 [Devosia sp. Root685]